MANVISLHKRQLFLATGAVAEFAKVYFYESGTATQVDVYADVDLLEQRSQPVVCSASGVMPVCYVAGGDPLRILATDEDDVALGGYPMDNIVPELAEALDASGVTFSPTEDVPETNVQDAIEATAALFTDQDALLTRYFTLHSTGGTSNAYTITPTPAVTAYAAGLSYMVMPDRANTGAATLNVNGVGAVNLMKMGSGGTSQALAANEILPYREFRVTYDGARFLMSLGRDFPLEGSNANGSWVKVANTLICRVNRLVLTQSSSAICIATWTLPAAMSNDNYSMGYTLRPASDSGTASDIGNGADPTGPMIGQVGISKTATAATITVTRDLGQTDFGNGNEMYIDLIAIGDAA